MKLLVIVLLLCPLLGFTQTRRITAKEASKFEGQRVTVVDSVYKGEVINDTTAVYYLGSKTGPNSLVVIHIVRPPVVLSRQPDRYIRTLQIGRIMVEGNIISANDTMFMIVRRREDFGLDVPQPDMYIPYHSGKH
jgi:hypothetical protein